MNVSVICPVFNANGDQLRAAVRSVLEQATSHSCEVILVDDGSTAAQTIASLRQIESEDARIRVIRTGQNGGPARARNIGLANCAQDWIGFIDADDLWPAGKLDRAEGVCRESPDARWIGGQFATLDADGKLTSSFPIVQKCRSAEVRVNSTRLRTPDLTRVLIGDWQHLGTSFVSRSLVDAGGGFDERLRYGEDWLLFLRMSLLSPLDYIPHEGYILRRQGTSLMRSAGRMSVTYARSAQRARKLPELRPFRRELRWFIYGIYKEIAMNNLLNRRRARALYFAVRAFLVSPNETIEFLLFWRLFFVRGLERLQQRSARYSSGDQIKLPEPAGRHSEHEH